ncbi:helix-turn-helix domain-containing protein [Virgibacillus salexigens]|uniref:Helix-turn-helix domain-containing protein n=1 Tax=Virgibacillus kapii TaxID=1638645 RepID=A0ABQ2DCG0_9BACI|nr:helix-turn-helix domain-containing protein [Virgibacillus kapii]GGJ49695.1 hypothetical protein GCM10007111_09800 [Virgibacillus kapii]
MPTSHVTEAINRQTFADKNDMDAAIKQHLGQHGADLPDTAVEILRLLSRHAVKYPGVAFLKHATIAKHTGKSRMTVIRNIKRLVSVGIIEKVSFMRSVNGGKGANLYVIQPNVTSSMLHREDSIEQATIKPSEDKSEIEPRSLLSENTYALESARNRNNIPTPLYNALSPFFQGAELRKYVGIVFRAKSAKTRLETHTAAFTACLIDCIRRYKLGEIRNLDGYIYASIRKLSRKLFLEEVNPLCG